MTDRSSAENPPSGRIIASGVDEEPIGGNERTLTGWSHWLFFAAAAFYTGWHLWSLNVSPVETWTYRIIHVAGALALGFGLMAAWPLQRERGDQPTGALEASVLAVASVAIAYAMLCALGAFYGPQIGLYEGQPPAWLFPVLDLGFASLSVFGFALFLGAALAIVGSWFGSAKATRVAWSDWLLLIAALVVALYLVPQLGRVRMTAGTAFAQQQDFWVTLTGTLLILELTRRVAGLALVIISSIFIFYSFLGPWLPGFLRHQGYDASRFFTYVYTDHGILGPTTAVSSTYIILFITFAAFLQASKVGDYFVNFAFAAAGRARGGPAKVAVFASGLMGMINGTSAGNVVATGSLTIPLMKKVGYRPQSAGAIEAAASTGGQIMPPIMGAGAFIMAEITGIPYVDIATAALIPAILYFVSIYFMVDFEALKLGMRGMRRDELPVFRKMLAQIYLFAPVVILIAALFMGYSVIRAGTLAMASAAVVSWLTPFRMGPWSLVKALELSARMSIQIIVVCACAGIIVGVIAMTGVGQRFSSLLLGIARSPFLPTEIGMLLAMVFAMAIAIILGMGMPTTAAYAVAASVVAPGLIRLGVEPLIAHFFVFYFAVISAITPPVALAAYAGAAIAGSDPMRTSATAFKLGLAAFIVPFMFFYSPSLLMVGDWEFVLYYAATATLGVYLLAGAVQGWFFGRLPPVLRIVLTIAALTLIHGGWMTDLVGAVMGVGVFIYQRTVARRATVPAE